MLDSSGSETFNDVADLGSNRRVQLDGTADHVVYANHDHGMALPMSFLQGVFNFLAHR